MWRAAYADRCHASIDWYNLGSIRGKLQRDHHGTMHRQLPENLSTSLGGRRDKRTEPLLHSESDFNGFCYPTRSIGAKLQNPLLGPNERRYSTRTASRDGAERGLSPQRKFALFDWR